MKSLACPDLFKNLYTLHHYGRELAHACDTVQGFTGERAGLGEQSCLSGTSRCVISGKPSAGCTPASVSCTGFV